MPNALEEKLRPSLLLLEYRELVDLGRMTKYGLSPILDPMEIPVHHAVLQSPDVYTHNFAQQVWDSVPNSIRLDIAAIEAKVGVAVPVEVTDTGVFLVNQPKTTYGTNGEFFSKFKMEADPLKKSIWVEPRISASAINLGLDNSHKLHRLVRSYEGSPIPFAKLNSYISDNEDWVITWYAHNIGSASLPLLLILRNFAIQFNNQGLQKLGVV